MAQYSPLLSNAAAGPGPSSSSSRFTATAAMASSRSQHYRPQQHHYQQQQQYSQSYKGKQPAYSSSSAQCMPDVCVGCLNLGMTSTANTTSMHPEREIERRMLVLLAVGTTLYALVSFVFLGGLLNYDDDDPDDTLDDALHIAVVLSRVWFFASTALGCVAIKGVLQTHLPSLRFFALHAISDTFLCGLVAVVFALAAFSSSNSVSSQLGHAFCEHLSRGNSLFGFVTSPGSGMENCEEKWQYGIAPLIMLAACVMLFVRAKTARAVWDYYRRMLTEGKISLESPSTSSIASSASSHSSSSTIHGEQYGEQQIYPYARATRSRKKRSETATSSSSSSGHRKPGHSRSSSSSTIRAVLPPGSASRIMLLPNDYSGAGLSPVDVRVSSSSSPSSPNIHTPRNAKSASAESVDTLRASHPLSGVRSASRHSPQPGYPQQHPYAPFGHTTSSSSVSHACVATNPSRKRSLSHSNGSGTDPQGRVVVYAPILMSIEEAQSLGGKEAVIEAAEAQAKEALASTRVHGGDRHSSEGRRHRGPSPVLNQPPIFDSRGDPIYPVPRHYSQPPREAHPIQAGSRTGSSKPRAQSTSAYEHHHHYYHASPRQQSDIEYVRSPREYSSHPHSTQYEQQVSQRFATSPQRGTANSRSPHRSRSGQTMPTLPPHQLGDNKSAAFTAIKGFRDESATEMVALRHPSHKTQ